MKQGICVYVCRVARGRTKCALKKNLNQHLFAFSRNPQPSYYIYFTSQSTPLLEIVALEVVFSFS